MKQLIFSEPPTTDSHCRRAEDDLKYEADTVSSINSLIKKPMWTDRLKENISCSHVQVGGPGLGPSARVGRVYPTFQEQKKLRKALVDRGKEQGSSRSTWSNCELD